ncbi:aminoglycoside phosphotransferase [Salipaludibacillus keqinensis]|uniref:Aminoglycoside phosphotransferase n=1 Tax=Salipaludibacillus keqinensis TaxID=2045207 RepID=A0A323TJ22_9BACI|nr:phosphotransferase [Salipaludibacillus keqinensis]PYZ94818.1 aminoglycoside phosphotransferase [Salipaludibacillus keqinensis]
MEYDCHLKQHHLELYAKKVFGNRHDVASVSKLHGGAQKVVYKVTCTNGFAFCLYVWDETHNYFEEEKTGQDLNERSDGSDLFAMNNRYLSEQSIRTPALYDLNQSRAQYPFDFALVEYVDGPTADAFLESTDPRTQHTVFEQIGDMTASMHSQARGTCGKLNDHRAQSEKCHRYQLNNAIEQLFYAKKFICDVEKHYDALFGKLHKLEERIQPRDHFGFIHGELGPNHVLVNENLEPFFIDIEGSGFYDVEHEHSFLSFRFGVCYHYFDKADLDPERMAFYLYCHHLALIGGGLKLLHRGFPDKDFAKGLTKFHTNRALAFL